MIYRKLKVSLKEAKDRFYRVLLVRNDLDLEELGVVLCTALGAEFEHMFLFRKGRTIYVDNSWLDGFGEEPMEGTLMSELGDSFIFEYDTGEGWNFECKFYKKETPMDLDDYAILLDGEGQGIWEDDKGTLIRYLDGELDPDTSEDDMDEAIYMPWNYENEKLSDFDEDYDLESEKEGLNDLIEMHMENYMQQKKERDAIIADKDDDYDDEDYEDDEPSVHSTYLTFASYMIAHFEKVRREYERLSVKYNETEVLDILAEALFNEVVDLVTNGTIAESSSYQKMIEEAIRFREM